jgi:Fur family zinc uptake transcriptional regulator
MKSSRQILQQLKDEGYKFTGKRQAIVDLFVVNRHKYLTAKDILEHVRKTYPKISFDTIYRTLSLLLELKVIEKLEFNDEMSKYRLVCEEEHHHHLICVKCGHIEMLDQCPIETLKQMLGEFQVVDHRFEIYGYCRTCRQH